jgi:hypothetical protein
MQQRRTRPHARDGDQAVERLADFDAGTSGCAVQGGRQHKVLETLETKDWERAQMALDQPGLSLRVESRSG